MSQTLELEEIIEELLYEGKIGETELDQFTLKFLQTVQQKSRDFKGREHLAKEIATKLDIQNQSYNPLFDALNFNFDDLSKPTRESIDYIAQIASLLKTRIPDDVALTTEILNNIVEESQLKKQLRELTKENSRLSDIDRDLDAAFKSWRKTDERLNREIESFNQSKIDANDRVEDILKPKNNEYKTQVSGLQQQLKASEYSNEIDLNNLFTLYEKMTELEKEIQVIVDENGEISSIPVGIEDGAKILEKKKNRIAELDKQIATLKEK